MPPLPRLIVFPGLGLGADAAWPQRALPFEVVGVDFIEPHRGETLSHYASRYGRALIESGVLRDPERTVLAGISFGSAVAQEIATFWPCAGVALLAGIERGDEIAPWLHAVAQVTSATPKPVVRALVDSGSQWMARRIGLITKKEAARCARMFRAFPTAWLREHARMAVEWPGCETTTPRLRIHGDRDWVVPLRRSTNVDLVLRGDRHLSSIARPQETNDALATFVGRVVAG
jgi:pimeloyl-ACP methyl ester carboxylesterase